MTGLRQAREHGASLSGDAGHPFRPFLTGLSLGACGAVTAGLAIALRLPGGALIAAIALFGCGLSTALAAECRRAWAGMLCGAPLAVAAWAASQAPDSMTLPVAIEVAVASLLAVLVLGSLGFVLGQLLHGHW